MIGLFRIGGKRRSGNAEGVSHEVTESEDLGPESTSRQPIQQPVQQLKALSTDINRFGLHLIPPFPLQPPTGITSYNVNVIAVHGLGGDFYKTWTYKGGDDLDDIFLLSHLLPHNLPGARIYSFGYESRKAFSRSVADVRDSAKQLLHSLLALPAEERKRPTIYLCHSLGGIIVKQAIITAHEDDHFADILAAAKAIMFMGTPHQGSDTANLLLPPATWANFGLSLFMISPFTGPFRTDLIRTLTRESKALEAINTSFVPRTRKILIISCYETEIPVGLQSLIVKRSSALLNIDGEVGIPLNADHMSMCRFSSLHDPNYIRISDALVDASTSLNSSLIYTDQVLSPHPSRRSLTESEQKYVLKFTTRNQMSINKRVEGTCLWSLRGSQFQVWRTALESTVLWITGEAGCGKTTITAFLIDHLEETKFTSRNQDRGDVVCSFFCEKDVETQKDACSILRGLLKQILLSRKDSIRRVKKSFDAAKHEFDHSFETLWKIFRFVIEVTPFRCLYIVIDALDECEQVSRRQLLSRLAQLLEEWHDLALTKDKMLKFIISGQPRILTLWNAVAGNLPYQAVRIQDRPEGMMQDIIHVIDNKVNNLVANRSCTKDLGEKLKMALYPRAENSFLWVSVVLDHIDACLSYREVDIIRALTNVPPGLYEVYAKYVPSIEEYNVPIMKQYIKLLVACAAPLSLKEMYVLAAINDDPPESSTNEERDLILRNSLERALGPLVRFAEGYVSFAHSTVKDFFVDLHTKPEHLLSASHGTDLTSAHQALATACARYLLLDRFSTNLFDLHKSEPLQAIQSPTSSLSIDNSSDDVDLVTDLFSIHDVGFLQDDAVVQQNVCSNIRNEHEAFDYAACNLVHHLTRCAPDVMGSLTREFHPLLDPTSDYFANWYRYMELQSRNIMPCVAELDSITMAALFDFHESLSRSLLNSQSVSLNVLQQALFWAASKGHITSTKILLEHDSACALSRSGLTPLAIAIQAGHLEICTAILNQSDVDPNFCNPESRNALVLAAASNHEAILHLLLAQDRIQVDQVDSWGYTALLEASRSASKECLQILIADGRADINQVDSQGRTALMHCSINGNVSMIKLLLRQADIKKDVQDRAGRNAISFAAEFGHLNAVKLLLRANASIATQDWNGRNVISWAANSAEASSVNGLGQSVLRLLVETNPEQADIEDKYGWTPLAWAMERPGYLDSVKTLIKIGHVDVNQCDHTSGRPILAWAASEGFVDIVEYLLLIPTLKKNLTDKEGCSALAYAARNGALEVVKIFLEQRDIEVNLQDQKGRTPLDWARLNDRNEIAECILHRLTT